VTGIGAGDGKLTDHLSVGVLTKFVPRHIVDEVVAECGAGERRHRLLPAHVVVYFVLSLALFRDGYREVMAALVHGLRFTRTWSDKWVTPSASAMCQARKRLGEEVMAVIFDRVPVPVAKPGTPGAFAGEFRGCSLSTG